MTTMTINTKKREMAYDEKKTTMNGRRANMPQSNDDERCDGSGFSYELTLLNKMAESERGGGQKVGYAQIPSSSSC